MSEAGERLSGDLLRHQLAIRGKLAQAKQKFDAVELIVLVFGPGEGNAGWSKRCQMRDTLNAMPGVSAYFPEDEALGWVAEHFGLSERDFTSIELVEADLVDLVLALETSSGVRDEVAILARRRAVRGKLIPFTPEALRPTAATSFSGQHRRGLPEYYTEDDFAACRVATSLCPAIVRAEQVTRGVY